MGHPPQPPVEQRVHAAVQPVVADLGLDLEALDIASAGRRRRVCVVVDRDGGIDLDALAEASRAVSEALDSSDAMGSAPYTLEVTSPGIDRPLTLPRHWRRNVGRRVKLFTAEGTSLQGRIAHADDEALIMALDSDSQPESQEQRLPWDAVDRGEVQVEFRRMSPEEG